MNNETGKYEQLNIFDMLNEIENKNKPERGEYDRCDHCNMPRCYGCKYLEEYKDE